MFWNKLGYFIIRSLNWGYENGELSSTQKQVIITYVPKEGKSKFSIANWRPITLLNTVYKIGSGCIARRIKNTLNKIISSDRSGFISGRYVGENTRLIYDFMNYTEICNIPGLLAMIDFEKAFDSVSWKFIYEVLSYFNFGPSISNWVKTFQNKYVSCVTQAGILSYFFLIWKEAVDKEILFLHTVFCYVPKFYQ